MTISLKPISPKKLKSTPSRRFRWTPKLTYRLLLALPNRLRRISTWLSLDLSITNFIHKHGVRSVRHSVRAKASWFLQLRLAILMSVRIYSCSLKDSRKIRVWEHLILATVTSPTHMVMLYLRFWKSQPKGGIMTFGKWAWGWPKLNPIWKGKPKYSTWAILNQVRQVVLIVRENLIARLKSKNC